MVRKYMISTLAFSLCIISNTNTAGWTKIPNIVYKKDGKPLEIYNYSVGSKTNAWALLRTKEEAFSGIAIKYDGKQWSSMQENKWFASIAVAADGAVYALTNTVIGYKRTKTPNKPKEWLKTQFLYIWDTSTNSWKQVLDIVSEEVTDKKPFPLIFVHMAVVGKDNLWIIKDQKPYHWNGSSLTPRGTIDGFIVDIAASSDGTVLVQTRVKNNHLQTLDLQIVEWNSGSNSWDTISTELETAFPFAVINKNTIIALKTPAIQSDSIMTSLYQFDGKEHSWKPIERAKENALIPIISAASDGTVWVKSDFSDQIWQYELSPK